MKIAFAVIALALAAGPAAAQMPGNQDRLLAAATSRGASWMRLPNRHDYVRFYPAAARPRHVPGEALVRCTIGYNGVLMGCRVLGETPAGYGFGAAALQLASRMRLNPITASGQSLGGQVIDLPIAMGTPTG
jgi:TonB family protein